MARERHGHRCGRRRSLPGAGSRFRACAGELSPEADNSVAVNISCTPHAKLDTQFCFMRKGNSYQRAIGALSLDTDELTPLPSRHSMQKQDSYNKAVGPGSIYANDYIDARQTELKECAPALQSQRRTIVKQDSYTKAIMESDLKPSQGRPNYERAMLPFAHDLSQGVHIEHQRLTINKRQDSYLEAIGKSSDDFHENGNQNLNDGKGRQKTQCSRQDSYQKR